MTDPKQEQIDVMLLVEELKAQRNAFCDQLAMAGALIQTLRKENEELKKAKDALPSADPPVE